jgi:hypothetical protein
VAGGSTGKPLLDVAQGTLDRPLGAFDLACAIHSENSPLLSDAFYAKLQCDIQQLGEPRP